MSPLTILLSLLSLSSSQFIPRYPEYAGQQDVLLEYMGPFSLFSPSSSSQKLTRSLPSIDTFNRQPGVKPKLSGFIQAPSTSEDFRQPGAAPKLSGFIRAQPKDADFLQPGSVPRLTGALSQEPIHRHESRSHKEDHLAGFEGPMTNPAAYFLKGTNFEKLSPPKCRLLNCAGPVPNDGSLSTGTINGGKRSACSQVLIPINSCSSSSDTYPMAFLCSVCCECTMPLVSELLKTSRNFH